MDTAKELKIAELNKRKGPVVIKDESLDKYDNTNPFPEKLAKANEILRRTGHPEKYLKSK
jgi:hypothetical protein